MYNLRLDPFERADFNSSTYWDWIIDHAPLLYEVQEIVAQRIADYVKYPPRQKPASFDFDSVMASLEPAIKANAEAEKEAAEKEHANHGVLVGK